MKVKHGNLSFRRVTILISLALLLLSCGYKDNDEKKKGAQIDCAMPCLHSTPTVDITSISSAVGGTINVTFTINNIIDLLIIDSILIELKSTTFLDKAVAGSSTLTSPTKLTNTVAILVNTGTAEGTYYPKITFINKTPENSGAMYYLDWTKSTHLYTYAELYEILGTIGVANQIVLSDMVFPTIDVNP